MTNRMGRRFQFSAGIVIERRRAKSPWLDYVWAPIAALPDAPEAQAWTELSDDGDCARYFCGNVEISLYGTESGNYLENLASAAPSIWVVLRPTGSEPPYTLVTATVDPAEGEGFTQAGSDLVGAVAIPSSLQELIAVFVEANPVQQSFYKRKRDEMTPDTAEACDPPMKAWYE